MSFAGDSPAKYRILSAAEGPRDRWRIEEDKTAVMGNSLRYDICRIPGVRSLATECWFEGIKLARGGRPPFAVLPDYSSVNEDREVAASEQYRLSPLGKIHWFGDGSYPPDHCACPAHLIIR